MRPSAGTRALTIVEVLVALALLAIISTAIMATFTTMTMLNRSTSVDVDYSRIVRSTADRTRLDWRLVSEYTAERVGGVPIDDYVDARSDGACTANVLAATVAADRVKVVEIVCAATAELPEQAFQVEFGAP